MRYHLRAVELEDGAGCAFRCGWVVDGRHALFDSERARPGWCGVGFSLEGGSYGGAEDGRIAVMKAAGFGIFGNRFHGSEPCFRLLKRWEEEWWWQCAEVDGRSWRHIECFEEVAFMGKTRVRLRVCD